LVPLHSFPTRRSSDLFGWDVATCHPYNPPAPSVAVLTSARACRLICGRHGVFRILLAIVAAIVSLPAAQADDSAAITGGSLSFKDRKSVVQGKRVEVA